LQHENEDSLLIGVRNGRLCRGTLHVNARLANDEAYIAAPGMPGARVYVFGKLSLVAATERGLVYAGTRARNRAMDGDSVAVEMLPRAHWRRRATRERADNDEDNVAAAAVDKDDDVDANADASAGDVTTTTVPTARVVGIIERAWRE
jgi:exoribonuclease R